MPYKFFFILGALTLLSSCSSINKKDCDKDMMSLGLSQGRAGSSKKYTDELRKVCSGKNPNIDLESYEKGFYTGWMQYCLPNKAFEKRYYELKDSESSIISKIEDLRPNISKSASALEDYNQLSKELESVRRDLIQTEIEGRKDNFKFL